MINFMNTYLRDENGAVTVEWVVLTAAVVGLAVSAYSTIGSSDIAANTDTALSTMTVGNPVIGE